MNYLHTPSKTKVPKELKRLVFNDSLILFWFPFMAKAKICFIKVFFFMKYDIWSFFKTLYFQMRRANFDFWVAAAAALWPCVICRRFLADSWLQKGIWVARTERRLSSVSILAFIHEGCYGNTEFFCSVHSRKIKRVSLILICALNFPPKIEVRHINFVSLTLV